MRKIFHSSDSIAFPGSFERDPSIPVSPSWRRGVGSPATIRAVSRAQSRRNVGSLLR